MNYLAYSLYFYLITLFFGLGFTQLLCPRNDRAYLFCFAPFVGYSYVTLLGWYLYVINLPGTDSYFSFALLPPLISYVILFRRIFSNVRVVFSTSLIVPLVSALVGYLLVSFPLIFCVDYLTSFGVGNNDIADSTSISTFLKQFARISSDGFLGQSGVFKNMADNQIFGGSLYTALVSSIFSVETYELQSLCINIFFVLSCLSAYPLFNGVFLYGHTVSLLLVALLLLSPVLHYAAYMGFQGQLISMGLATCLFTLNFRALRSCEQFKHYLPYLPLSVLFAWGLSVTYPHMLVFVYIPISWCCILFSFANRSASFIATWLCFLVVTLFYVFLLSPARAFALVDYLFLMGTVHAGWYIPCFSLDVIFGLSCLPMYDNYPNALWHLGFSVVLLCAMVYGYARLLRNDRQSFLLSISCFAFVALGYCALCILGKTDLGWGGYKSYKWLSFFMPLVIASSLPLFRLTDSGRGHKLLTAILLALVVWNFGVATCLCSRLVRGYRVVERDMVELRNLASKERVQSINIRGDDWWNILWEINFLMSKRLYFETSTYNGRAASPLIGEWDLVRLPLGKAEAKKVGQSSRETIPINARYMLVRAESGSVLPLPGFRARISILQKATSMPENSQLTIPILVENIGDTVWHIQNGTFDINLGYHWWDSRGRKVVYDGIRTRLPHDLSPGGAVTLDAVVRTPQKTGTYVLEFDMVQEHVAWFRDKGSETARLNVKVK